MQNFLASDASLMPPANDNVPSGYFLDHPCFGSASAYLARLAQQKNMLLSASEVRQVACTIFSFLEPERIEKLFGGEMVEPCAEALWLGNNFLDGIAADNMTLIFAEAVNLSEDIEELRALADRLFDALKSENAVGAPTRVWPSIKLMRFVAIIMRRFEPRGVTVDTVLEVMTRVAQEGALSLDDDMSALWELSVRLFKSPYEFNEGGNVVKVEFT